VSEGLNVTCGWTTRGIPSVQHMLTRSRVPQYTLCRKQYLTTSKVLRSQVHMKTGGAYSESTCRVGRWAAGGRRPGMGSQELAYLALPRAGHCPVIGNGACRTLQGRR